MVDTILISVKFASLQNESVQFTVSVQPNVPTSSMIMKS